MSHITRAINHPPLPRPSKPIFSKNGGGTYYESRGDSFASTLEGDILDIFIHASLGIFCTLLVFEIVSSETRLQGRVLYFVLVVIRLRFVVMVDVMAEKVGVGSAWSSGTF